MKKYQCTNCKDFFECRDEEKFIRCPECDLVLRNIHLEIVYQTSCVEVKK